MMMTAKKIDPDKRRAMGAILSRSFTLSQCPLTPIEESVYGICCRAAAEGRRLESIEQIAGAIGATGMATVPGIMKRLESKGYIERRLYQRGRQVMIAATGEWTAPPNNLAPHWRIRAERVPAPAIHKVTERSKPLAVMIEAQAKALGKPLQEFLMDCVYAGFHEIMAEQEAA